MTSNNNRAPLLYYVELCASFQIQRWIQTGVTVRKRSIPVKIGDFLSRVTLKFDGWSWKTIGHLLYTTSSFVHHTLNFGQNWRFFALRDIEINQMTLKNNRTTFLYHVKLCASFQSHHWIQTGVTVWRRSIRVEIGDFLPCVTLESDRWPWNTTWHLFYTTLSFVDHFKAITEFKLELQPRNAQFGSKSMFFVLFDLEISQMTLKNNRWPLLCYFKLCA